MLRANFYSHKLARSGSAARSSAFTGGNSAPGEIGESAAVIGRKAMRFLLNATLMSCSVQLLLAHTSFSAQRQEELTVEKKVTYIPAGSGQKPFDATRHVIPLDQIQSGGPPKNGIP